jgi:hypothetical protein
MMYKMRGMLLKIEDYHNNNKRKKMFKTIIKTIFSHLALTTNVTVSSPHHLSITFSASISAIRLKKILHPAKMALLPQSRWQTVAANRCASLLRAMNSNIVVDN